MKDTVVPATNPENSDSRTSPRSNVFLSGVLNAGGASCPVRIRNLSARGALLEGAALPIEEQKALLRRGSLSAKGEIVWRRDKHCGIRFDEPVEVREWVKRAGPEGQQRIDAAIAEFRHGPQSEGHLAILNSRRSEGPLESASADLLRICERIAALPDMSTKLAEELLKIDAIAHSIRAEADYRR